MQSLRPEQTPRPLPFMGSSSGGRYCESGTTGMKVFTVDASYAAMLATLAAVPGRRGASGPRGNG